MNPPKDATRTPTFAEIANHRLFLWGIEGVRPVLDSLDRMTLATIALPTAMIVRQKQRMPFRSQPETCTVPVLVSSKRSAGNPN